MSAAWLLSGKHRVTVYERDGRLGGHSHTVDVAGPEGPLAVDTGFIVFNEGNYPNLTQLFRHLGVETRPSTMSFAASLDDGTLEYSGSNALGLFAQPRNLMRSRFWRMLADTLRFYREGPGIVDMPDAGVLSLGDYLDREKYSTAFVEDHLLPMAAAIWSTPVEGMRSYPALAFIRFCQQHGLMRVTGRPQWRTVVGGSRSYVRRLTAAYADRVRLSAGVRAVRRLPGAVFVEDEQGGSELYDHVVIAAHADDALAMLTDASADERTLLGAFTYTQNVAVLHGDQRLMPRRRRVWSSWNYLRRHGATGAGRICVSYWMNQLQGLDERMPLFVTLNPPFMPDPGRTHAVIAYDHPTYDIGALSAQQRLHRLQGQRNTWFCGSYFGAGFHEDALSSGLSVAEHLGGVSRPWALPMPVAERPMPMPMQAAE
jgi:predicted NAD/FAD-binding protein